MKQIRLGIVAIAVIFCLGCSESPTQQVLGNETGTLRGTLTVDGAPRSGYSISVGELTTVTESDGRFEFAGLDSGYQPLEVHKDDFLCSSIFVLVTSPETVKNVNLTQTTSSPPGGGVVIIDGYWVSRCL